jgi:hypothetical protein
MLAEQDHTHYLLTVRGCWHRLLTEPWPFPPEDIAGNRTSGFAGRRGIDMVAELKERIADVVESRPPTAGSRDGRRTIPTRRAGLPSLTSTSPSRTPSRAAAGISNRRSCCGPEGLRPRCHCRMMSSRSLNFTLVRCCAIIGCCRIAAWTENEMRHCRERERNFARGHTEAHVIVSISVTEPDWGFMLSPSSSRSSLAREVRLSRRVTSYGRVSSSSTAMSLLT